jgi:flagellar basal-body rod modification protein FlgD
MLQVNSVTSSDSTVTYGQKTLGQDDFLRLLVTQLKLQDPLKPLEEKEFIAQLAQFSALDGINRLTDEVRSLAVLAESQMWQNAGREAVDLIGKQVTITTPAEEVAGVVTGVRWFAGQPWVIVGDVAYELGQIYEVSLPIKEGETEVNNVR